MKKKLFFRKSEMIIIDFIKKFSETIPLPRLSCEISMHGSRLSNIIDPIYPSDAITLSFFRPFLEASCQQIYLDGEKILTNINNSITNISSGFLQALPIDGGIMRGNINMGNTNTIKNLPNPKKETDILNLSYLRNSFVSMEEGSPFLDFENKRTITDLADPDSPTDAVNLKTLNDSVNALTARSLNAISITGDTLQGNITMSPSTFLTNLKLSENSEDTVCLFSLQKTFLPFTGGSLQGNCTMSNGATIKNLTEPVNEGDIVTLKKIKDAKKTISILSLGMFPISGGTLSGPLQVSSISGIATPVNPTDIVNLSTMKRISSLLLLNTGDTLEGNLNALATHRIQDLATATLDGDIVNFASLQKFNAQTQLLSSHIATLTSCNMTGDLYINTLQASVNLNRIINVADPRSLDQPITLNYLKTKMLPLSGGIIDTAFTINENLSVKGFSVFTKAVVLQGSLKFNIAPHDNSSVVNFVSDMDETHTTTVTGIPTPSTPTNAVNLAYAQATCLPISHISSLPGAIAASSDFQLFSNTTFQDTVISSPLIEFDATIHQNVNFNGNSLRGILDAEDNYDMVTLSSMNNHLNRYIALSGGALQNNLNLNQHRLYNLAEPVNDTDIVSLSYLNNVGYLLAFYKKDIDPNFYSTSWTPSSLLEWNCAGLAYTSSTNASSYFKIADASSVNTSGNTAIFLAQGYLYQISIAIRPMTISSSSLPFQTSIQRGNTTFLLNTFDTQSQNDYQFSVIWASQKDDSLSYFSDALTVSLGQGNSPLLISSLSWTLTAFNLPR